VIASAIALIVLGIVGVWQAAETGQVRCRGCSTINATDDPVQYGLYVMLFMWCVPAGLAVLVLGVRDARRKRRTTGSPPARSSSSDGSGGLV